MRVFKYPLGTYGDNMVRLPPGAKVVHVHDQDGVPCLWALVDTDSNPEYEVQSIPPKYGVYLGTTHTHEGSFVLHVFGES